MKKLLTLLFSLLLVLVLLPTSIKSYEVSANEPNYLTFTGNASTDKPDDSCYVKIEFTKLNSNAMYRTSDDAGLSWSEWKSYGGENLYLRSTKNKVQFKAQTEGPLVSISGSVSASGDVTSLINGVGGDVALTTDCFSYMFNNCKGLTTAPNLPSTTLAKVVIVTCLVVAQT